MKHYKLIRIDIETVLSIAIDYYRLDYSICDIEQEIKTLPFYKQIKNVYFNLLCSKTDMRSFKCPYIGGRFDLLQFKDTRTPRAIERAINTFFGSNIHVLENSVLTERLKNKYIEEFKQYG